MGFPPTPVVILQTPPPPPPPISLSFSVRNKIADSVIFPTLSTYDQDRINEWLF